MSLRLLFAATLLFASTAYTYLLFYDARTLQTAGGEPYAIPLTAQVVTELPGGPDETFAIRRLGGKVHVAQEGDGLEWVFHRDETHPAALRGVEIRHRDELILDDSPVDALSEPGGRSFLEIASLGVTPEMLAFLEPTGAHRRAFGLTFTELRARRESVGGLRSVLWNDELRLPLESRWERAGQEFVRRVVQLELEAEEEYFSSPELRFPAYTALARR